MKLLAVGLWLAAGGALGAGQDWKTRPFDPRPLMAAVEKRVRPGQERFSFVVMGDSRNEKEFPKAVALAERLAPDFIVHTGDMVSRGAAGDGDWDKLAASSGALCRKTPFWPVLGNHETMGGSMKDGLARFLKFYGLEREYYSFALGRHRFIILSWMLSDKIMDREGGEPEGYPELRWLRGELAGARNQTIFVFSHMPLYTAGSVDEKEAANKPTWLTRLFTSSGVRAVFSGHDHIYYRTQREGVHYLISAGAGAGFHELDRKGEAMPGDVWLGAEKGKVVLHQADGSERALESP